MSKLTNLELIDPKKIDERRKKYEHLYFTTEETLKRRNEEKMRQRVVGDMIIYHTNIITTMKLDVNNLREEMLALKRDMVDFREVITKIEKLTALFK